MSKENYVALTKCYYCGGDNQVVLHKRFGDVSELNGKVIDMTPCSECAEHMKKGILLITIDLDKSEDKWYEQRLPNPFRTGTFAVVKDEAIKRVFNPEISDYLIRDRWGFIPHDVAKEIGLVK